MAYSLSNALHFCICSERAVFLDLSADRYFCLPFSIDQDFQRWLADEPLPPASLDKLAELGVLRAGDGPMAKPVQASISLPTRDLREAPPSRLSWMLWATYEQFTARIRLRRQSFSDIVTDLQAGAAKSRGIAGEQAKHARLAAAFAASRLLVHNHNNCLSHSLAFERACRRLGLQATFVIGVRLDPFSAHCWVQCNDLVMNDSVERVRHFTPILTI